MLVSALFVLVMLLAVSQSALGRVVRAAFASVKLPRVTLGHVVLLLIVIGVVAAVMWWAKSEGLVLLGPALPEALAWFAALDAAAYFDVIALMAITAAVVRVRTVRAIVRSARVRGGQVLRRAHRGALGRARRKPCRPSRNTDDEPGWAGWPAFA